MKIIKRILLGLLLIMVVANLVILVTGNSYLYKTLIYQQVGIDDFEIFHNRTIEAGTPTGILNGTYKIELPDSFRKFMIETEVTALLVLQNDSIVYEEYWDGYGPDTVSGSFSVAKTIVSIMIGIAIDEGKIKSVDQKVCDFLPEFSDGMNAKLTIKHLLTMSAGFNWNESYASLFSPTTKAYYGNDLRDMVENLDVVVEPGTFHEYQSISQVVLAIILEKVTGKSLSEYTSEKLWKPLGATHDALWSLDHEDGLEKAYCCFNSNARDFSRIGSLFLHKGELNGKRIVSEEYVKSSVQPCMIPDETGNPCDYYGYSWWVSKVDGHVFFYARGILGQYVIVVPDFNLVIVRLGRIRPDYGDTQAADYIVSNILKTLKSNEKN
ncbi:MAG: hypothetical protein A2W93_11790 [Bacteroidetes bacterium GWF2_43_63]|nr:MAG: hypothetical protein A2W94_04245 [Bacteroidetes bacterium GWE2_42_42]OFY52408.1 MAG: hypothetical protein A2W93_11790 [Bacteroidetes bacterium GWF2_43_63]HBG71644.1 serine hydrolase [Bacteroidales bacterium]HCB61166.1 serine hydrolase [Bacteroidales bacterium]HCY23385.1 serine hydrolase [Bacteroidales bacterium]